MRGVKTKEDIFKGRLAEGTSIHSKVQAKRFEEVLKTERRLGSQPKRTLAAMEVTNGN